MNFHFERLNDKEKQKKTSCYLRCDGCKDDAKYKPHTLHVKICATRVTYSKAWE